MNSLPEGRERLHRPPPTRFLFDELLPWKVARALRELGYKTSYVGSIKDNAPERGSPDQIVLEHAKRTNQIIITSNHDMIVLIAEQGQSFIWLDPRGKKFKYEEMVVRIFLAAYEWGEMLSKATEPICVHALRTKNEVLTLDRAAHLVNQRMRRLAARKRRTPKPRPHGPLLETTST